MIAVLLAMKHLFIPTSICIIVVLVSCAIILILAPVEDANKPLDDIEQIVYRKRTYAVTGIDIIIFFSALIFGVTQIMLCAMWVMLMVSGILIAGKIKNGLVRTSDIVHETESERL